MPGPAPREALHTAGPCLPHQGQVWSKWQREAVSQLTRTSPKVRSHHPTHPGPSPRTGEDSSSGVLVSTQPAAPRAGHPLAVPRVHCPQQAAEWTPVQRPWLRWPARPPALPQRETRQEEGVTLHVPPGGACAAAMEAPVCSAGTRCSRAARVPADLTLPPWTVACRWCPRLLAQPGQHYPLRPCTE